MQQQSISHRGLRRRALAVFCAALPAWSGAQAPASGNPPAGGPNTIYTVINMGSQGSTLALNDRGHATFSAYNFPGEQSGFFDGDFVRDIGSLGGTYTSAHALNKDSVVVGTTDTGMRDHPGGLPAFKWTQDGGMRALAGTDWASARAINDHGEIVGLSGGTLFSALRWNADGSLSNLRGNSFQSAALAINNRGFSTGFASALPNEAGPRHAVLWDRDGQRTDLGSLGSESAAGLFINERDEVLANISSLTPTGLQGFFWSRDSGVVPIRGEGESLTGLNNHSVAVGNMLVDQRPVAFQWTLARRLVPLPLGSALGGHVSAIQDNGEMVGNIVAADTDRRGLQTTRAARWPGMAAPIDLNKRLHRPPAGLVLTSAEAINGSGVILAYSNAGLVMLRPGQRGTDAPVLGPVLGLPENLHTGQDQQLSLTFADNDPSQTHTASAVWGDGCASPAPTVSEAGGAGQARWRHVFCAPGYYSVTLRVTDSGGRFTDSRWNYYVADPGRVTLSGEGTLADGPGARGRLAAPLRFALWTPLDGAASSAGGAGQPLVSFYGPFNFRSDRITSAVARGNGARVEGTGRLDGRDGYRFVIEAVDGKGAGSAGPSRLRVRLTHADASTGAEVVDYDNAATGSAVAAVDRTAVTQGTLALRR